MNPIKPIIEKAKKSDLVEILALQKLAYQQEAAIYNDNDIPPLTQTLEEFREEAKNVTMLKAIIDNKIVGSIRAYVENGICYVGRVIVHPDYQNNGIGKILMLEIEKHFKNARKFELFTGMQSEKNLYLYKKLGYAEFKTVKLSDKVNLVYLCKKNKERG